MEEARSFNQKQVLEEVALLQKSGTKYPRPVTQTPYVAPRSQTETTIAEAWGELLGIDEIGVHDDFFEMGGHSLLALQLISRMRNAFSVELKMRSIFDSPTVAGLSQAIEGMLLTRQRPSEPALTQVSRDAYRVEISPQDEDRLYKGTS
jgi:acyl carrier protein